MVFDPRAWLMQEASKREKQAAKLAVRLESLEMEAQAFRLMANLLAQEGGL